jgi:hypothetical protein
MKEHRTKSKQLKDKQYGGQRWCNLQRTPTLIRYSAIKTQQKQSYAWNEELNLPTEKVYHSKTKIDA